MVDLLIRRGANVNAKTDKKKVTPLHIASQNNKHKIAELLIQHGAVVDALSPAGFTPLHFTNFSGDLRIAELLLKNGANVNLLSKRGYSPLTLSSEAGNIKLVT